MEIESFFSSFDNYIENENGSDIETFKNIIINAKKYIKYNKEIAPTPLTTVSTTSISNRIFTIDNLITLLEKDKNFVSQFCNDLYDLIISLLKNILNLYDRKENKLKEYVINFFNILKYLDEKLIEKLSNHYNFLYFYLQLSSIKLSDYIKDDEKENYLKIVEEIIDKLFIIFISGERNSFNFMASFLYRIMVLSKKSKNSNIMNKFFKCLNTNHFIRFLKLFFLKNSYFYRTHLGDLIGNTDINNFFKYFHRISIKKIEEIDNLNIDYLNNILLSVSIRKRKNIINYENTYNYFQILNCIESTHIIPNQSEKSLNNLIFNIINQFNTPIYNNTSGIRNIINNINNNFENKNRNKIYFENLDRLITEIFKRFIESSIPVPSLIPIQTPISKKKSYKKLNLNTNPNLPTLLEITKFIDSLIKMEIEKENLPEPVKKIIIWGINFYGKKRLDIRNIISFMKAVKFMDLNFDDLNKISKIEYKKFKNEKIKLRNDYNENIIEFRFIIYNINFFLERLLIKLKNNKNINNDYDNVALTNLPYLFFLFCQMEIFDGEIIINFFEIFNTQIFFERIKDDNTNNTKYHQIASGIQWLKSNNIDEVKKFNNGTWEKITVDNDINTSKTGKKIYEKLDKAIKYINYYKYADFETKYEESKTFNSEKNILNCDILLRYKEINLIIEINGPSHYVPIQIDDNFYKKYYNDLESDIINKNDIYKYVYLNKIGLIKNANENKSNKSKYEKRLILELLNKDQTYEILKKDFDNLMSRLDKGIFTARYSRRIQRKLLKIVRKKKIYEKKEEEKFNICKIKESKLFKICKTGGSRFEYNTTNESAKQNLMLLERLATNDDDEEEEQFANPDDFEESSEGDNFSDTDTDNLSLISEGDNFSDIEDIDDITEYGNNYENVLNKADQKFIKSDNEYNKTIFGDNLKVVYYVNYLNKKTKLKKKLFEKNINNIYIDLSYIDLSKFYELGSIVFIFEVIISKLKIKKKEFENQNQNQDQINKINEILDYFYWYVSKMDPEVYNNETEFIYFNRKFQENYYDDEDITISSKSVFSSTRGNYLQDQKDLRVIVRKNYILNKQKLIKVQKNTTILKTKLALTFDEYRNENQNFYFPFRAIELLRFGLNLQKEKNNVQKSKQIYVYDALKELFDRLINKNLPTSLPTNLPISLSNLHPIHQIFGIRHENQIHNFINIDIEQKYNSGKKKKKEILVHDLHELINQTNCIPIGNYFIVHLNIYQTIKTSKIGGVEIFHQTKKMKKNDRYKYNYKEDDKLKNIWDGGNFYEGKVLEKIPMTKTQTTNNLWEVSFERKKSFVLKKDNFLDDITLNNNIYEVSSFIVNHGHSRNKCHNHCIIKKKNNWYFCSDTYIEEVPNNDLIHTMCFSNDFVTPLIFYKRKDNDNLEDVNDNIKGLRNFGNTCFFNCILQCLFHNKYFNNYVKEIKINQPTEILRNHFLENININTDSNNKYKQKYFKNINIDKYKKRSSNEKNYKEMFDDRVNLLEELKNDLENFEKELIKIKKDKELKDNVDNERYEKIKKNIDLLQKNPLIIHDRLINLKKTNLENYPGSSSSYNTVDELRQKEQELIEIIKDKIKESENINIDVNEINKIKDYESLKKFIRKNEQSLIKDIDIAAFIYYSNILNEDKDDDDEEEDEEEEEDDISDNDDDSSSKKPSSKKPNSKDSSSNITNQGSTFDINYLSSSSSSISKEEELKKLINNSSSLDEETKKNILDFIDIFRSDYDSENDFLIFIYKEWSESLKTDDNIKKIFTKLITEKINNLTYESGALLNRKYTEKIHSADIDRKIKELEDKVRKLESLLK